MTPAQRRRAVAMGMVVELYCPTAEGYALRDPFPYAEAAENIRKLAPLGRTDRWRQGIETWAGMVERASWEGAGLDDFDRSKHDSWAFFQGHIIAGWAAS